MGDDIDASRATREEPVALATVRYLRVAEFMTLAAAALGMREEELCVEQVVELAHRALDAPAAEAGEGEERHQIFPTLAEKAAEMCRRLLTEPPIRERAGQVGFRCLEAFLFANEAEWHEDGQRTVLLFNRILATPEEARELEAFMRERIVEPSAPRRPRGSSLFSAPESAPTVVYMAGPLKDLPEGAREQLEAAEAQVNAALRSVRTETASPIDIRLEHPSTKLCREQAPEICDEEVWQYTSGQLIESVDALIVVDFDRESAGFGATSEFDLHCLQDGPVLYLRSSEARPSRILDGRAAEHDVEIVVYGEVAEIEPIVRRWTLKRWHAIRSASRRRDDRQLLYRPLQRSLLSAWQGAKQRERDLAAAAAGMFPRAIDRVLTSTAQLSVLPSHRLDALCRELGVASPRTERVEAAVAQHLEPDYGALLEAAREELWSGEVILALYAHAERSARPRPYETRLIYRQKSDWKQLHGELFG